MGGEADPAGRRHRVGSLDRGSPAARDLVLDAERQAMALLGGAGERKGRQPAGDGAAKRRRRPPRPRLRRLRPGEASRHEADDHELPRPATDAKTASGAVAYGGAGRDVVALSAIGPG